ncbi:MAG: hypothetical protein ACRDT2_19060, partial [Natronosporangium sp.]
MSPTHAVRRLGVVAAVTALTSAIAAPTLAQADPVSLEVSIADTVVAAGGSNDDVSVIIAADRAATLADLTFTFDVGGLAGVAALNPAALPIACDTSGDIVTCADAFGTDVGDPLAIFDLELTADPGANLGDTGTLTVAVEATGATAATDTVTVTIGTPIDLVAGGDGEVTTAIGDSASVPWSVQNAGPEPAAGVTLWVGADPGLAPQTRHGNCVYYGRIAFPELPHVGLCTFDVVLEPATTYEFSSPLEFEVRSDAPAPAPLVVNGIWMTRFEGAAMADRLVDEGRVGVPGTGPALELVQAGGGAPAPASADPPPAADLDPDNNFGQFVALVEGNNKPDFAAVGARLDGEVGDLLSADVGVRNVGPALANSIQAGDPLNLVRVTVPDGTTAVEVPDNCSPAGDETADTEPGAPAYLCTAGFLLPVGETESFPFVLRIDQVIPDVTGRVEVNQSAGEPTPPADINPDNDLAEIVVNPTAGGGTGGGLPVTGSASWLVGLAGALLLALGASA